MIHFWTTIVCCLITALVAAMLRSRREASIRAFGARRITTLTVVVEVLAFCALVATASYAIGMAAGIIQVHLDIASLPDTHPTRSPERATPVEARPTQGPKPDNNADSAR